MKKYRFYVFVGRFNSSSVFFFPETGPCHLSFSARLESGESTKSAYNMLPIWITLMIWRGSHLYGITDISYLHKTLTKICLPTVLLPKLSLVFQPHMFAFESAVTFLIFFWVLIPVYENNSARNSNCNITCQNNTPLFQTDALIIHCIVLFSSTAWKEVISAW